MDSPPTNHDAWDLDRLRLSGSPSKSAEGKVRAPRHKHGETFLQGPIPFDWMATACRLPGSGLHVASTALYLHRRFRGPNRWGLAQVAQALGISHDSVARGLEAAEEAGLVTVDREPGCKAVLSVPKFTKAETKPEPRPLYGPVPWLWWSSAARLPGKSLQLGAACWFVAGWERSGEFMLGLADWAELGLSRFSAGRALEFLDGVGLVSVRRQSGLKPIVRLLDACLCDRPVPIVESRRLPTLMKVGDDIST